MRRIAYGFLIFLVIILGAALIVPFFLSVNDYKPQIVAQAKKAIGRDVHIDGDLSLSILPSPKLTIEKVRVANVDGGSSKDFLTIARIKVSLKLLPLLKKHLKISSLVLDKPEIFLEKLDDGRVNWNFAPSVMPSETTAPATPSSTSSKFEVDFDKVKISNGSLAYLANGQETQIQNINTTSKINSLAGPYAVVGSLKAFDREIAIDGNFGTSTDPQHLSLKLQVEDATSQLEGKLALSPFSFHGHLKASAESKMVKAHFPTLTATPYLTGILSLDGDVVADGESIVLKQTKFEVGTAQPTGDLHVSFKDGLHVKGDLKDLPGQSECTFGLSPSPKGLKGNINATVTQAKELLTWLAIETQTIPPEMLGALAFSTHFTLEETTHLTNLNLTVDGAKLHGDVSYAPQKNGSTLVVDLETPKLENILKLLGVKNPKHLGDSKLKGKVQIEPTSIHLSNLHGHLGKNFSFSGDVGVDHKAAKPKIKAVLAINSINMDTLLASREVDTSTSQIILVSTKGKRAQAIQRTQRGSKWSNDPLDFSYLQKFDGQFDITSSELRNGDIIITQPKLQATVQNGRLEISSLNGAIYGGTFRASGHLTADNVMRFHILLQDANLKQLTPQGGSIKLIAGKLSLSSEISTHGGSIHDMVQHLAGPLTITAKDGIISGFDLPSLSQRLATLQNPQSLLGLLTTSMGQGQTPFSSFKGELVFNEGIGTIQSMTLIANGGQGQAAGRIDLPHYTVDVHADFRLIDHPKLPPFHMQLTGPIDNPSRKLDSSALQKYMMDNVFKGVIGSLGKGITKPKELLGSLIDGITPSNKADPAPQQSDKGGALDKPTQVVKDIFKGIF